MISVLPFLDFISLYFTWNRTTDDQPFYSIRKDAMLASTVDSEVFFAQEQRIFHFHQERKTNKQVEYKLLCCSHFTETEDFLHSKMQQVKCNECG